MYNVNYIENGMWSKFENPGVEYIDKKGKMHFWNEFNGGGIFSIRHRAILLVRKLTIYELLLKINFTLHE